MNNDLVNLVERLEELTRTLQITNAKMKAVNEMMRQNLMRLEEINESLKRTNSQLLRADASLRTTWALLPSTN